MAGIHSAVVPLTVIKVVHNVNCAETYHRHALVTPLTPSVEGVCDIEIILSIALLIVARTHKITVGMDIGERSVSEYAPRDGDKV